MFSFFKKEKWIHVKTITIDDVTYGTSENLKDGKIFIHLYESDKGSRRIESASSFSGVEQAKIDRYVNSHECYQLTIVRWLGGRLDPEIPRYSQIGEEDTANALRGRVV
jgi:hypothetical protein